jgi:hypothetical protein
MLGAQQTLKVRQKIEEKRQAALLGGEFFVSGFQPRSILYPNRFQGCIYRRYPSLSPRRMQFGGRGEFGKRERSLMRDEIMVDKFKWKVRGS